ncbi:MAG: hypothetical protein DRO87_11275 [Candidatus Thorarchaeota archaeon]|nr:MAG: hypothetical protein DRO87_11275 [Candidatus Thorarchaeota archaeon]
MVGRRIGNIISYDRSYQQPAGWRGKLESIRKTLIEYNENFDIFTAYEKQAGSQAIADIRNANEKYILSGAVNEWHAVCDKAAEAVSKVEAEKQKEISSWDAGKLSQEMNLLEKRIEIALVHGIEPGVEEKLKDMYLEGINSGDRNIERATAEVYLGIGGFLSADATLEEQMAVNRLSTAAGLALAEIRNTKAITDAEQAATEAVLKLNAERATLRDVDAVLGFESYGGEVGSSVLAEAISERVDNTGSETVIKPRGTK